MARRKKPRFSYTYGSQIKGQGIRKNPSFMGGIAVLAMLALFYFVFGRNDDFANLSGGFVVHYIDVGQGDSILIQTPDNDFMLIDTGENSQYTKLSSYLEHYGVRELKYAVFTHPHSDHMGSAARIVQEYPIEKLIMPPAVNDSAAFRNLLEAAEARGLGVTRPVPGDSYRLGEAEFLIVAPLSQDYENLNNYSIVILMNYGDTKFLFTGDMERESENELLKYCEENSLDIRADVLKVAHHGSSSSSQNKFLDLIKPRIAVIQVGLDNSFNHPNLQIIERLENTGALILRNDWHGDIMIISDGRELSAQSSRGN